ncbi:BolA/IbaG family iron-sulfur metabolism protein [Candidatus Woesearchaeota archaeon]|nr:BolA/IbaG family iron-sulfur metabolism protein [Candidatus Woesearchaeota archaeon]
MLSIEEIKQKIEAGLPGAKVEMLDPRRDGVHLKAMVSWHGFKGKSLIEQHKMVYAALKEELKEELHALSLETKEQ